MQSLFVENSLTHCIHLFQPTGRPRSLIGPVPGVSRVFGYLLRWCRGVWLYAPTHGSGTSTAACRACGNSLLPVPPYSSQEKGGDGLSTLCSISSGSLVAINGFVIPTVLLFCQAKGVLSFSHLESTECSTNSSASKTISPAIRRRERLWVLVSDPDMSGEFQNTQ